MALLPDPIEPDVLMLGDGRRRALVSAVSFRDIDVRFRLVPSVRLGMLQANYRAYVRAAVEHAVWFLGSTLSSPIGGDPASAVGDGRYPYRTGAGQAAKACNQLIVGSSIQALAEAFVQMRAVRVTSPRSSAPSRRGSARGWCSTGTPTGCSRAGSGRACGCGRQPRTHVSRWPSP